MSKFFFGHFLGWHFFACVGLPRRIRVRVRVTAVGPWCLPVFLRTGLFLVFDYRLSDLSPLFSLLVSSWVCVSPKSMPRTQTILNFTQRLPGLDIRLAPRPHIPVERNVFFDETWHFPSEVDSTAPTLPKKTRSVAQKNKQHKGIENFICSVKCILGLTLESAGKSLQGRSRSKCTHCNEVIENILERWERHRRKCEGLKTKRPSIHCG